MANNLIPPNRPAPQRPIPIDIAEDRWKSIGQITLPDGRTFSVEVCGLKKNEGAFSPIENFGLTPDQINRCHDVFTTLGREATPDSPLTTNLFKDRTTYLYQNTIFDKHGDQNSMINPVLTASIQNLQDRVDKLSQIIFPGSAKRASPGVFRSTLNNLAAPAPQPAPGPVQQLPGNKPWWKRLFGLN